MKIIAHRGLLEGPNTYMENRPTQIEYALFHGVDAEIDVWYIKKEWWLGHNEPQYQIDFRWLRHRAKKLWLHCKNVEAMNNMSRRFRTFNAFWHNVDKYTFTTKGFVWAFPGEKLVERSIAVMPESYLLTFPSDCVTLSHVSGICTDFAFKVRDVLLNKVISPQSVASDTGTS